MLKAAVCDIGHVIARGSILNVILAAIGKGQHAKKLYDARQFYSRSTAEFDTWTTEVIEDKVAALQGLSRAELMPLLDGVTMTPGFDRFIRQASKLGVPVLLVGAVPDAIAHLLIQKWGLECQNLLVRGTELLVEDEKIVGLRSVCTPTKKREIVESWLASRGIKACEAIYIGDSVGDLLAMSLFPKENRVAINASMQLVRAFCGHCVEDSFSEITALTESLVLGDNARQ
jgi:phosphoserine phosphatase